METVLAKLPAYLSHLDPAINLPSSWSSKDKPVLMELVNNSLQVQYKGAGKSDEACAVRANYPIPSVCGIYYWEIEVISKGRDGYMGIGLSGESVLLTRLPGWETNSYGYHADDGNSFCQSGSGKAYGPTFSTGDIVGCGYNFIDNTVFFTKNGFHLGVAFRDLKGTFYPTVGLRTPGEIVIANFGQKPFRYDIESFMRDERLRLRSIISQIDLTPMGGYGTLNTLVLSYLVHHGYAATAQSLASTSGLIQSADGSSDPQQSNLFSTLNQQLTSIKERQRIRETLLGGNIDDAMELAERLFPTVLAKNPPILFQLKCRKFVEMVRRGNEAMQDSSQEDWLIRTITYGQELQDSYTGRLSEAEQAKLEETYSLLAYPDPFKSPVAHLLDTSGRETVANALNSAILVYQQSPPIPPLEKLVRQVFVTMNELSAQGVGSASIINVRQELL